MRKTMIFIVASLTLLSLTACQSHSNSSSADKSTSASSVESLDKSDLFKKFIDANAELESLRQEVILSVTNDGSESEQMMDSDINYNLQEHYIDKIHVTNKFTEDQEVVKEEDTIVLVDEGQSFSILKENDEYEESYTRGATLQKINPHIKQVIDILADMEDDFDMEEEGNYYIFTLNNQEVDVLSLFHSQFGSNLDSDPANSKKSVEFVISKEDFYMQSFEFELLAGSNSMEVEIKCSNWNDIDDSVFDIPEEAKPDSEKEQKTDDKAAAQ